MSVTTEIITEVKNIISADTGIADFCVSKYGKSACVKAGRLNFTDMPIGQAPTIVVSNSYEDKERRRFLFNEKEAYLLVFCGILQKDEELAEEELMSLKELIKLALKKDPLLNGKAVYSAVAKSKRVVAVPAPLRFIELTVYVNYRE